MSPETGPRLQLENIGLYNFLREGGGGGTGVPRRHHSYSDFFARYEQ
jgi:hypothetical protein